MEQQTNRAKWLTIRVTPEEYQAIEQLAKQSTCRSVSEYARKTLAGKPIIMRYRNQSLDDFVTAMLPLQNQLQALGNNFNQSVKRLHTIRQLTELREWILLNEQDKTRIFEQIETINSLINKAYKLWSQE